jgi:predicted RNA-binding protein with PIN domain
VPRDLLRPVVERTMDVVRAGVRARPPVPAPPTLAPLLRFRHLPAAAHDTVVVALDTDATLRDRVRDELAGRDVNRVAWLWLTRPVGWDTDLREALGEVADDGAPSAHDTGTDAALRRRLSGAERALARAEQRARQAEEQLARVREQLDALRAVEPGLREQVAALRDETDELRAERTRTVGELKRLEKLLVRRDDERRELLDRVRALESAAAAAATATAAVTATAAAGGADAGRGDGDRRALAALADRIERAIGEAALHLDSLRAEAGLAPSPAAREGGAIVRPGTADRPAAPKRRPLPMPRGLTDDSVEAAAWLLTERPVLLVDGYNVSMAAWPDADIAEQRQRLVRLMADLAARTPGLGVEVVFDGATTDATPAALPARTGVNVRFTAHDVEADDELLSMVARYPVPRPVVVASTDRRVRDGARRRGANVLSAHQLLAVARG